MRKILSFVEHKHVWYTSVLAAFIVAVSAFSGNLAYFPSAGIALSLFTLTTLTFITREKKRLVFDIYISSERLHLSICMYISKSVLDIFEYCDVNLSDICSCIRRYISHERNIFTNDYRTCHPSVK